jgi:two-component system, OmpR family, sensor kinase
MARVSLRVRLVAVAAGLAAVALAICAAAGLWAVRGYLRQQADNQLQTYAGQLVGKTFTLSSYAGPAGVGAPRPRAIRVEVLGAGLRPLLEPGAGPGPGIPARIRGRQAQAWQVSAGAVTDGSWRVILLPVRYRAEHIQYAYGAQDIRLLVTSRTGPGLPGTLLVGMDQGGVGRVTGRLTGIAVAASAVAVLVIAAAGLALLRSVLRPLREVEQTAAAVATGQWSHRVPDRPRRGEAGRLVESVNLMLGRLGQASGARARAETAARQSAERLARQVAAAGRELRASASVIRGCADYYQETGDFDRLMTQVDDAAERMTGVVDELQRLASDRAGERHS